MTRGLFPLSPTAVLHATIYPSLATLPFIRGVHTSVKGYERMSGFKIRSETMWLER
jgi:hypothetical protein